MRPIRLITVGLGVLLTVSTAGASALTFIDDYEGFVEAAPTEVRSIDFETLPDGSPSYAGAVITPDFNYTHLGATFLPHYDPGMYIYGNSVSGFRLSADSYPNGDRTWIIAEPVEPASAVGTYFVSSCILSAYDAYGGLIAELPYGGGGTHFIGIVSDTPIAYATIDRGTYYASSDEFLFADIPEPSSGAFLVIAGVITLARHRGWRARR